MFQAFLCGMLRTVPLVIGGGCVFLGINWVTEQPREIAVPAIIAGALLLGGFCGVLVYIERSLRDMARDPVRRVSLVPQVPKTIKRLAAVLFFTALVYGTVYGWRTAQDYAWARGQTCYLATSFALLVATAGTFVTLFAALVDKKQR